MVRQQGRCRQTGLPGLLQTTGTSRASIQGFNISSSLYRHILTQYPRCSFSQLAASCGKCFECGTGANWLGRSSRRARGTAGRVANERCTISASSLSFSLLALPTFIGMITFCHKLFRLDSRRSSSIFFAGAGHRNRRGDDVREVRDGYSLSVVQLQRRARN